MGQEKGRRGPRGILAAVRTRTWRLTVGPLIALLTLDLVDGPTPSGSEPRLPCASIVHALSAPEAQDAEFFCARATVVAPVVLMASDVPLQLLATPSVTHPAFGFPTPPFRPPKLSL